MLLSRIDLRIVPIILCLMAISLSVISSMTADVTFNENTSFWTPFVKAQLRWFFLGWVVFLGASAFDYRRLRQWSLFFYLAVILLLVGLFFFDPVQNVHRWYRFPFLPSIQPSEPAKLVVIMGLSWFLERKGSQIGTLSTALQMIAIAGIPFILILKQPDLGTALVLYPIVLVLGYVAGVHKGVL